MTASQIRDFCLALPGATEQIQWRVDLVFKVAGKMFLVMATDEAACYSFKCSDQGFLELTEFPGIRPAPYLARAHWVQIDPAACQIDTDHIAQLIRRSYDLVVAKLPKKTRIALAPNQDS